MHLSGLQLLVAYEALNRMLSMLIQMYGCNVLNLGSSRIISVNPASARRIVKDPHFKGDVQVIHETCSPGSVDSSPQAASD